MSSMYFIYWRSFKPSKMEEFYLISIDLVISLNFELHFPLAQPGYTPEMCSLLKLMLLSGLRSLYNTLVFAFEVKSYAFIEMVMHFNEVIYVQNNDRCVTIVF